MADEFFVIEFKSNPDFATLGAGMVVDWTEFQSALQETARGNLVAALEQDSPSPDGLGFLHDSGMVQDRHDGGVSDQSQRKRRRNKIHRRACQDPARPRP